LKCSSKNEKSIPDEQVPHKFSKNEIINYFGNNFEIKSKIVHIIKYLIHYRKHFFVMKKLVKL